MRFTHYNRKQGDHKPERLPFAGVAVLAELDHDGAMNAHDALATLNRWNRASAGYSSAARCIYWLEG